MQQTPIDPTTEELKSIRALRNWKILKIAYIVVVAVVLTVLMLIGDGPAGWICEWQAETFMNGRCSVTLSILLGLFPFLLLLIPIKFLFEKITGIKLKREGSTKLF